MTLLHIRARFECDECGQWFEVDLDPASGLSEEYHDLDNYVSAQALGATITNSQACAKSHQPARLGWATVVDGKDLCGNCGDKT